MVSKEIMKVAHIINASIEIDEGLLKESEANTPNSMNISSAYGIITLGLVKNGIINAGLITLEEWPAMKIKQSNPLLP